MPNMRNMVFIVTPKLVYEAARDYNKEKKGYDSMMNEEATITPEEKKKRDSKKNSKQIEEE
jgi:type II secretory pathway component GspD/PulD (secretin)